jgi:acetyl-CoA acetyltransferase
MASLKTVFRPEGEGVVTAGNSSQLTDGASAVLVGDREVAQADGFTPWARFVARVAISEDPVMQLTGVIPATRLVLKKAGLSIDEMDWIEINEAFASVVLSWADELGPDMDKVNPWSPTGCRGHSPRPSPGRHRRRPYGEDARRPRSHRRPVRPPGHVHRPRHVHCHRY